MFNKKVFYSIVVIVGLVILSPQISFGAEQFSRDLSFGFQQDSDVAKLQEFLSDEGLYSGPITGNFFSLTLKAVKAFQSREGITPAAGYFGPKTRMRANALLGAQIQASNQQVVAETGQNAVQPIISQTTNNPISNVQSQLEILLKQVALLQQQLQTQQQNQTSANAPVPTFNQNTTSNAPSQNSASAANILEITSVNITLDKTSAKVEWQTNKPTESKVFISGGNLSSKIFTSISGLSTRHSVTITGLSEETSYSYEIEAIAGGVNAVKKQGSFKTLPPPPLFEFNPIIKIGGTNPNGTHWYPQLIDASFGGYVASDIGHVYFSINENYDGCVWGIKDPITNISPGGWNSYHKSSWERPVGTKIPSGQIIDTTGYSFRKTYVYEFTCRKSGFRENTVIGEFIMPPFQKIYTEKRIAPWTDYPDLHGEFKFWNYGVGTEESLLDFKIKITLSNDPAELKFYKNGSGHLWISFPNISNGDIVDINSFPSKDSLIWSFSKDSGNVEIVEGTATKNGVSIPFKF
ncbi:MAG: peptidoglycan-binding protein [Patescibacteria group bacterium]